MKAHFLFLTALMLMPLPAMGADEPVACPMIAKLCPDGSYVSPQGPKCEMAPCPNGGDADLQGPSEENCNGDDCEDKETDAEND